MSLKEDIFELISQTLDVDKNELKEDISLYDSIGVDSTEMVELRVVIKKKLGVELEQGEVTNKHTPNQIAEMVESKK
ncbi:MAG: acyl carrier protein [Candidatus Omnitrophica bacterium]|nr:acyl carrier protein [Candidatus Omnitrophota bacterium]MBU2044927.1 acyl carrier protein [Candidatus Omnitrophota bacterium]MBU2473121.1 acyl carrier protein [Candidatus Omnitrophota bacterium]